MKRSAVFSRRGLALAAGLLFAAAPGASAAEEELTVASWSGAYLRSQILGYIDRFEEETGIDVEIVSYTGGIDEIREQVISRNVKWDVVDLELFDAIRAQREGLLEPIPGDLLTPAPDGAPAAEDFIEGTLFDFGVGNVVFSTVVGYNREALERAPTQLEDFFNLRKFPGRRGLRRTPKVNLEWALIADGVDPGKVYAKLETEKGLKRAFRSLDRIKPQIVWWERGLEAVRKLRDGEVAMTSAWSGRMYAGMERGAPLGILWDHQHWLVDVWSVVKHTKNREAALKFVRFASTTESLARQTEHIAYGPARRSAIERVDEATRERLPTAPGNFETAFEGDAEWWAEHIDRIRPRFERWLERPVRVPKRLRR